MPVRIKPTGMMVAGLPTLTPAQFALTAAAKKPGASYAKYQQFINTRRGVTQGPKWPGRGGPGLPTIESMIRNVQIETPAQIQARANAMTAAQVKAQTGLVNDQAASARAAALRAMQSQTTAGQAAVAMNKDLFGLVGGEYNAGARELAGLATGGVSDASDTTAADTAAINASLASLGQGPIDARMAGPQQAGVAAYQAGLGAKNLVTQGEAQNFGLAGLISSQGLRATQEALAGQRQADLATNQSQADAIREIARTRPDLAAKALAQLQDSNRQQIALGSTLLQQRRAALQAGFQQGITKTKLAQDIKVSNAALKAAATKAADKTVPPSASLSRAMGYLVDANGNPILNKAGQPIVLPGFKVGKDGKVVKTGTAAGGGKAATPGEVQTFLNSLKKPTYVTQTVRDAAAGTTQQRKVPGDPEFSMPFQQAYRRLITWGKLSDKQARQYLQSIYQRGEHGRDWLTNEEQTLLGRTKVTKNLPVDQSGPPHTVTPSTHAGTIKDPKTGIWHGYLTATQMAVLQKAGKLPAGSHGVVNGKPVWYIAPGG